MGSVNAFGQIIQPAVQSDIGVFHTGMTMAPKNTGIAIAPNNLPDPDLLNIRAFAFDDASSSNVMITWEDGGGNQLNNYSFTGSDPDVEFWANPDLCGLVYEDASGNIVLNTYYLRTIPNLHYLLSSSIIIDQGTDPNIDICSNSSTGEGVITYEKNGSVMLALFNINHPNTVIHPNLINIGAGAQPDAVISDHPGRKQIFVTYIQLGTHLITRNLDHTILRSSGTLASTIVDNHWGTGGNYYAHPRIAVNKSVGSGLSFDDFTVVAEFHPFGSTGTEIMGFTYNPMWTPSISYLVNQQLEQCANSKPVVAYIDDRVTFAWSANYAPPCSAPTSTNTTYTDVLMIEHDATFGIPISGTYHEVNQLQGPFYQSNVSINSQKDGDYTTQDIEVILYSNNDDLFHKARTPGAFYSTPEKDNDRYAYHGEASSTNNRIANNTVQLPKEVTGKSIELLGNPVESKAVIVLNNIESTDVSLRTLQGQEIGLDSRMTRTGDRISIDVSELATGTYYLNCVHDEGNKTFNLQVN